MESNRSNTNNSTYWCHSCNTTTRVTSDLECFKCKGNFIEYIKPIEEEEEDNSHAKYRQNSNNG